jgi:hypothetical protein
MKSLTSQQKSDIQTLGNFLNDPAWMELYGYNTFTIGEVTKLYEHLNSNKKGNLHREALAKEALILFPHRARGNNRSKKLIGSIVIGIGLLVIGIAGGKAVAFMIWG